MVASLAGLTRLSDRRLSQLLQLVHRKGLRYPLRRSDLIAQGLPDVADGASVLIGLDEAGVRAVLVAVLAERRRTSQGG